MKNLILVTIICLSVLSSFAQEKKLNRIVINAGTHHIKAQVLQDAKEIKTEPTKTYYWFRGDKIHTNVGGYDGHLLNGEYEEYLDNGNLLAQGMYKLGLKTGTWKEWDDVGELRQIATYISGVYHGDFFKYVDGDLTIHAHYKQGALHGETISYTKGKELKRTYYEAGVEVPAPVKKGLTLSTFKKDKEQDIETIKTENSKSSTSKTEN